MRGYRGKSLRAGYRFPPIQQSPTVPVSLSAPIGGWNARDPLAAMKPTDAVVLDNFYPGTGTVDLRPGRVAWSTGIPGNVKSILSYISGTSSKLFAVDGTGFYDITTQGAVGASVSSCTDAKWEYRNISTSGGSFLLAVNGVDDMKLYNGTTWTDIDGVSTPSITGVVTSDLSNIHLFKSRIWLIEKQSLDAWYLPAASVGGAATKFPMGPIFRKGGYLVAQESWTIDGGTGLDDYLISVTSEGEISIYQGNDPSVATDWGLVGVYETGRPIGKRCFRKYGGDVLYLSELGIFPLSKLLLSATLDRSVAISNKIEQAFNDAIATYSTVYGWNITIQPLYNAIVVNVPTVEGNSSVQFVMNNITKAWCRFTNWSADVYEVFKSKLYSALGGTVYLNWTGTSDLDMPIQSRGQTAYLKMGNSEISVGLVRPVLSLSGTGTIQTAIDTDFNLFTSNIEESYLPFSTPGDVWDQGLWDSAVWSASLTPANRNWLVNPNNPGFFHSFRLQCSTSNGRLSWVSTDFAVIRGGVL